jgi:hypothetical protein
VSTALGSTQTRPQGIGSDSRLGSDITEEANISFVERLAR